MARPYSLDLRERVVAAVRPGRVAGGGRDLQDERGERGEVVAAVPGDGSAAAKPMGGSRRVRWRRERDWLLSRLEAAPDVTLRALVAELGERGVVTSYGSVWRIVHDAGLSCKKNSVRHRARSSRRGAKA